MTIFEKSKGQTYCAVAAVGLLLTGLVNDGRSQGPFFAGIAPVATFAAGAVAGEARAGGIVICANNGDSKSYVKHVAFDAKADRFTATLNSGEAIVLPNDPSEMAQLSRAALASKSCVEVSIDPVADTKSAFFSPQLAVAPGVTVAWLDLDGNLGAFLEGGSADLPAGVTSPSTEAQRLLMDNAEYGTLARKFPFTPATWHHTTLTVNPLAARGPSVSLRVDPTPISLTPDGRRFNLRGDEKTLAAEPYMPLVHALENNPEAFAGRIEGLEKGMAYARSFGILAACANAPKGSCAKDLAKLQANLGDVDESLTSELKGFIAERESQMRSAQQALTSVVRRSHLQTVWQNYRMSLDPKKLSVEERVAIFVDEALGDYSDMEKARDQAKTAGMSPEKLLTWVDGIDLSTQQYGGWAELGKFTAGVWAARPLPELNSALCSAYARALASNDRALQYETLKAAQVLAPVIASNWTIANQSGSASSKVEGIFDPLASPNAAARTMDSRAYLTYLSSSTDKALDIYTSTELAGMQKEIDGLASQDGRVIASLNDAFKVIADFENSRLSREKARLPRGILVQMEGDLQYSIASAAVHANDLSEARDRLRMLQSLESEAKDQFLGTDDIELLIASLEREIPSSTAGSAVKPR